MGFLSRIVSAFTGSNSRGSSGGNSGGTSVSNAAASSGSVGAVTGRFGTGDSNPNKNIPNKPSTNISWPNPTDPNSNPWSLTNILNNINNKGIPLSEGSAGIGPIRKEPDTAFTGSNSRGSSGGNSGGTSVSNAAASSGSVGAVTGRFGTGDSNSNKNISNKSSTGVSSPDPNYQASKEAINAYMSGTYFGPTWEKAKERNPLLTDEGLLEYYKNDMPEVFYANLANSNDPEPLIKTMEQRANEAYALKRKRSPDYIAKDYNEYVDMVNQGLIAPRIKMDTTGKQISVPYGISKEDYNAYLQRKYADNGDDYYNRNYGELAKSDPNFWKGSPEAFDADGNPVDTNTYLWLLNNPLTRTVLQGMDASGNFSGAGPTMEQLARDPSNGGYGLYSERDVADMYASHILAGDEMGAMLESNPELMSAILTQAYTPKVDPNNPVTYDVPMKINPDGSKSRDASKGVSGTLNLAEDYKTPIQLAAGLIADPTSAEGMNNLQILAAANEVNKQNTTTPEKDKDEGSPSPGVGSGSGDYRGGGGMPAGGNPETNDTLYSMPEVGNYAARMILNKMLPTGYDYDYNKRLDKRLADIAAAEQNYKGNVLPSVERTYQDQAANTLANLVAALRANRASGLTSGASRGAQAASDVQAVQAASKENSENLRKLVNDNLASFLTQLASKRATAGNDTASELQGYASPMMTALGEVLAQYNYGSAAAQVNNGGLRRMQSYLV